MSIKLLFVAGSLLLVAAGCRRREHDPTPGVDAGPPVVVAPDAGKSALLATTAWPEKVAGFEFDGDLAAFGAACTKGGGKLDKKKSSCDRTLQPIGVDAHVGYYPCQDGTSFCGFLLGPGDEGGDAWRSFKRHLIAKYGPPTRAGQRPLPDAIDFECRNVGESFKFLDRWDFDGGREISLLAQCQAHKGQSRFLWSVLYTNERKATEDVGAQKQSEQNF